ncbi:MAG: TonB family protein [Pseudomonadota bacterium]|nr:TonB family protein [Pseudomonadota bacterium]
MSSIEVLAWLKYATFISSAATALILLLRKPLRRWLGAQAAYALWWLLPLALAGSLLPARKLIAAETAPALLAALTIGSDSALHLSQASDDSAVFIGLWLGGMLLMLAWLVWQQGRFLCSLGRLQRRDDGLWLAEAQAGLPALMGIFRPRIVLPLDFDVRYDAEEQRLMLLHENAHRQSFDMPGNALAAALRVLFWFNPLLHFAAARFRHDQELACDARVLQQQPQARRRYAGAMLKTHIANVSLPVGCHWGSPHPLKERVMQMQRKLPQKPLRAAGMALAVSLALASGFAAWAMQPATSQLAGSAQNDYSAEIQLAVDGGKAQRFTLNEGYGRGFEVKTDAGELAFAGQINPVLLGEKLAFRMDGNIQRQGQAGGAPVMLLVEPGKRGSLRTMGEAGALTLSVSVTPRDMQAARNKAQALNGEAAQSRDLLHTVIKRPLPVYPPEALRAGIEGRVRVLVDVNADGTVKDARVGRSEPAGVFDEAALTAVQEMLFAPQGRESSGYIEIAFVQDK